MTQSLFVSSKNRATWKKILASFLAISLNLTGGIGALILTAGVAHADTTFVAPNETITNNSVANPDNGWISNSAQAVFSSSSDYAEYGFPDLGIPATAGIIGIEISIEAYSNKTPARDLIVSLWNTSNSAPDAFTSTKQASLTKTNSTLILGTPTDTWGKTWTASDFADTSFKIRVGALTATNGTHADLDSVQIKVYYTIEPQTITVTTSAPASAAFNATFPVAATASSGLTVAITTTGGCSISGSTVTMTSGTVSCVVHYNQAGNGSYSAAPEITETTTANPKNIIITATAGQAKVYGLGDPTLAYTSDALVGTDSFTGTLERDSGEDVASYPITLGTLSAGTNYSLSLAPEAFAVTKKPITATADPKSKAYGTSDPELTYGVTGTLVGSDEFTGVLERVPGEDVGEYLIDQGTLALSGNYELTYNSAIFAIGEKAVLSITADDKTVSYGDSEPSFTFTLSGLVNGDEEGVIDTLPTCSVSATHSDAGTYGIECSGGSDNNYAFSYESGVLTVNKADATVSVNGYDVTFDDASHTAVGTVTGVHDEDLSGSLDLSDTTHTDVGNYLTDEWILNGGTNYHDQSGTVNNVISATKPVLTVIKQVINDNGGTKEASDFTLHVGLPGDVCFNIPGIQTTVPEGKIMGDNMQCLSDDTALNTIMNWFSVKTAYAYIAELFSVQTFVGNEEGTVIDISSATDYEVTEDASAGYTTTYSEGCSGSINLGEHLTCIVTNNDIAPVYSSGGNSGGSSTYDYWGCTNPSAQNFNTLANRDDNSCVIGGGSGEGVGSSAASEGEVLGASTIEEPELPLPAGCSAYITTYMKMGKRTNDVEDVKRLQTFLNEEMGATLPVSGFFGPLTKSWVKKFQKVHHAETIQPWIDAGHDMSRFKNGSGVVYKTTKRAINIAKCATVNEPAPDLVNDNGL